MTPRAGRSRLTQRIEWREPCMFPTDRRGGGRGKSRVCDMDVTRLHGCDTASPRECGSGLVAPKRVVNPTEATPDQTSGIVAVAPPRPHADLLHAADGDPAQSAVADLRRLFSGHRLGRRIGGDG